MSKSDLIISKPEKRTKKQLRRLQALPLEQKINLTNRRIEQFYTEMSGKVCVSCSFGKDSMVLLHLVRSIYTEVKGVFVNTGLEYPELIEFGKTIENVDWIKPNMTFPNVIKKYGYPLISKKVSMAVSRYKKTKHAYVRELRAVGGINPNTGRKENRTIPLKWQWLITAPFDVSDYCCDIMKKDPLKRYQRVNGLSPYIGTMADESEPRTEKWIKNGCNIFDYKTPQSNPLMFWTESDIWEYIKKYNMPYSKIYDMGEKRTGCMFCLYGCQYDDEGGRKRFDRMKINHPKQYRACEKIGVIEVLHYLDKKLGRDQLDLFE